MRLCIVTEYFDETGSTPTILRNLAVYLIENHKGLEIDVITSRNLYRGDALQPRSEVVNGIRVTRLNTPRSNKPSTVARLISGFVFTLAAAARLLARSNYDLVLVVTNPPSAPLAAQLLSRFRRVPYVYLIHDLYPDVATVLGVLSPANPLARMLGALQKSWLRSADKVVVLGRCMKRYIETNYAVRSDHIEVITNWCDPEEIVPRETSAFRSANEIGGVSVLYAGNFGLYQDFDDVLDAAKLLRETHSDINFVLVGGGAREAQIRQRIEDEDIHNVRIFPLVGRREYPDILAAADIALIVLATNAEGLGVPGKFYNVLASGRPTIAVVSPESEVALVLNEEDCGIQVSHGSPADLANTVVKLAGDKSERERMGNNARAALIEHYTLQKIGDHFWMLMCEVARTLEHVAYGSA